MGRYDTLIPGSTTVTAPTKAGRYDSLIPTTPPSPPSPGIAQTALSPIVEGLRSGIAGFKNTPSAPKDFNLIGSTVDTFANAIKQGGKNLSDQFDVITKSTSPLNIGVAEGQAAIGTVNALFGAALAPLQGLAHLPGVGHIVDGVNKVFGAIGEGAGGSAVQTLNELPIPDSAKQTLTPLVHDAAALAAQIYAGKLGGDAFGVMKTKVTAITDALHNELQGAKATIESTGGQPSQLPKVISPTGESTAQPVPFANQYEQPGTIQMGPKPKDALPVAAQSPTGASVAPETAPIAPEVPGSAVPPLTEVKPRSTQNVKPIQGTGELKTRGVAQSVEASAIEKGLVTTFGDLPNYRAVNFKDQAQKVNDLIVQDPANARAIALGEKAAPKDIIPEMVAVGIEKKAMAEGDVQTLQDIANSKLTTAATTMGQRIAAYGQRDVASPIDAIREVQQARAENLQTKGVDIPKEVAKETKNIKSEITKAVTKSRPSWEGFITSITCGY